MCTASYRSGKTARRPLNIHGGKGSENIGETEGSEHHRTPPRLKMPVTPDTTPYWASRSKLVDETGRSRKHSTRYPVRDLEPGPIVSMFFAGLKTLHQGGRENYRVLLEDGDNPSCC